MRPLFVRGSRFSTLNFLQVLCCAVARSTSHCLAFRFPAHLIAEYSLDCRLQNLFVSFSEIEQYRRLLVVCVELS